MAENGKYLDLNGLGYTIRKIDGRKANVESPAFTGTPTAPTASQSTNNEQIATTAFVNQRIKSSITQAYFKEDKDGNIVLDGNFISGSNSTSALLIEILMGLDTANTQYEKIKSLEEALSNSSKDEPEEPENVIVENGIDSFGTYIVKLAEGETYNLSSDSYIDTGYVVYDADVNNDFTAVFAFNGIPTGPISFLSGNYTKTWGDQRGIHLEYGEGTEGFAAVLGNSVHHLDTDHTNVHFNESGENIIVFRKNGNQFGVWVNNGIYLNNTAIGSDPTINTIDWLQGTTLLIGRDRGNPNNKAETYGRDGTVVLTQMALYSSALTNVQISSIINKIMTAEEGE